MLRKLVTMDGMCKGHFIAIGTLSFSMHKLNKAMISCLKVNSLLYTRNQVWNKTESLSDSWACLGEELSNEYFQTVVNMSWWEGIYINHLLVFVKSTEMRGSDVTLLWRVSLSPAPYLWPLSILVFYCTQSTAEGLFLALFFVYEISPELLNGFVPNVHGRCVWSLAWKSLKVKVTMDKKQHFLALLPACVRFVW